MTGRARALGLLLLVAAAGAAVYLPVLGHGFVYDDHRFVEWNGSLDGMAAAPWRAFDPAATTATGPEPGMWRPLRTLSFALDRALLGPGPEGHHLASLLLHGLAAGLVFALGRRLGVGPYGAAAGAAFFAFHPAQVEAVAWISSRGDLLAAALLLGAVAIHLRGGVPWGPPALAALAFLSKESAVVAPLLLAAADFAAGGRERVRGNFRAYLVTAGVLLAGVAVRGAVLAGAGEEFGQGPGVDRGERTASLPGALAWYAWRTLVPLPGAFDLQLAPGVLWGMLFLAGLSLLALWHRLPLPRASARPVRAAALWAVAALLPVTLLQVLFPLRILVADRFLYLALAGPALALGALAEGAGPWGGRAAFLASPLLLLATVPSQAPWRSDEALWGRVLERTPGHPRALHGMAFAREVGDPAGALPYYRAYLEAAPGDAGAWFRRGLVEERLGRKASDPVTHRGRFLEAAASFGRALELWEEGGVEDGRGRGRAEARLARAAALAAVGADANAAGEAILGHDLWVDLPPERREALAWRMEELRLWARGKDQEGLLARISGRKPPPRAPVGDNGGPR